MTHWGAIGCLLHANRPGPLHIGIEITHMIASLRRVLRVDRRGIGLDTWNYYPSASFHAVAIPEAGVEQSSSAPEQSEIAMVSLVYIST